MELIKLENYNERQDIIKDKVIVGIMFLNCTNDRLVNKWVKEDNHHSTKIAADRLANELNTLMLNFLDIQKLKNLCGGEGFENCVEFVAQGDEMVYFLRVAPVEDVQNQIVVYKGG